MRGTAGSIAKLIFPLLLTANFLLFSAGFSLSADPSDSAATDANVREMMAGLTDEQVRQLLIDELQKGVEAEELDPEKMKGPAYFLARLLGVMSSEHDDNKQEVRALFGSFSTMGPDLYKVFIKL